MKQEKEVKKGQYNLNIINRNINGNANNNSNNKPIPNPPGGEKNKS